MIYLDFFPFPFVLGLLLIALAIFRLRKRGRVCLAVLALFGIYLLTAINLLFFPLRIPQNWPANLAWHDTANYLATSVNLVPFYYGPQSIMTSYGLVERDFPFREIAANLLLTIPFGLGIQYLAAPSHKRAIGLALLAGLAPESVQLLIQLSLGVSLHVIDINDVLLNTLGVVIGYGIYAIVRQLFFRRRLI